MTDQEYELSRQQHLPNRLTLSHGEAYQLSLQLFRQKIGLSATPSTPGLFGPRSRIDELINTATRMLLKYPATHYFTLTYYSQNSSGRRQAALLEWLDALEWLQRRPLAYLTADEESPDYWSGLGMPGTPYHHHGVLFGAYHLSPRCAEELWHKSFGDALVQRFEPGRRAIPYVLKQAFLRSNGEWGLGGRFDKLDDPLDSVLSWM